MFEQFGRVVVLLALFAVPSSLAFGQEATDLPEPATVDSAVMRLVDTVPQVRVDRDQFGRTFLFGAPMGIGESPDLAVEAWIAEHSRALGLEPGDLELLWSAPLSDPRAHAFAFRTRSGDVSIEGGAMRVLVREDADTGNFNVVYAAAHTALVPEGGYPDVSIPAERAALLARQARPAGAIHWHDPRLIIEPSATRRAPSRLVWHVAGHVAPADGLASWTVVIDPVSGTVLEVRDELLDIDVQGEVRANITPGNAPDGPGNPPVEQGLGGAQVRIIGGAIVNTAPDGTFTIPNAGSSSVTVEAVLLGDYVQVIDQGGANAVVTAVVTPPGPVTLVVNPNPDPLLQAQVNGFHFTNVTHDFVRDRTTGIPSLDVSIPCNVNINDNCNAFFDPGADTINFFTEGNGCVNTAFASVVSHEYGHFIVDQLGVGQGAFGEGFGDIMSMFIYDDPIIGRDFSGPGTVVRDPVAANIQYPCNGAVHFCGQLIGGTFWGIRQNFGAAFGSTVGLEQVQQLFVDWSLITLGGQGDSSAHPQTAIEVLTIDDDDGNIDNGTPRRDLICAAFADHSIDCPVLPPLLITFPFGRPDTISPQTATEITVDIEGGVGTLLPSTAALFVRSVGSSVFAPVFLTSVGGDRYTADIPAQDCGGVLAYYVGAQDTVGNFVTVPAGGESEPFEHPVYDSISLAFADDMETDTGWVVGVPGDTATTGIWERVDPVGTAAAPSDDNSDPGTQCWVTGQGVPGGGLGANDVDGGFTTLTSPLLDLSAPGDYIIRYARWFSNDTSAQPNTESLTIDISGNDGASWTNLEVVGPTGPGTSGGWFTAEFVVSSVIAPTGAVRLRFVVGDPDPGSLVEAAIDDLEAERLECTPGELFMRGEVNGDLSINLSDAVTQLLILFEGAPNDCQDAADSNDDGSLNLADVITLLSYLFSSGADLPAPFGACGVDPTDDPLDCAVPPACP